MRIVFWKSEPSIHAASLISAIADLGLETHVVLEEAMGSDRAKLGWSEPCHGSATVHRPSTRGERHTLEARLAASYHVFWGLGVYAETALSLRTIVGDASAAGVWIFSEPYNPHGFRGSLRRIKYRKLAARYGANINGVLCAGPLAVEQFAQLGLEVQPFGYCVPHTDGTRVTWSGPPRFLFVGQLIDRKGLDIAMKALVALRDLPWSLKVVGDGVARNELAELAGELRLYGRIQFVGAVGHADVQHHMLASDALLLPSRFEGWGAVVNEALQSGLYCIVSDRVGAQDLLHPSCGRIHRGESTDSLRVVMQEFLNGHSAAEPPELIAANARSRISAPVMARFLVDILMSRRVGHVPPWKR